MFNNRLLIHFYIYCISQLVYFCSLNAVEATLIFIFDLHQHLLNMKFAHHFYYIDGDNKA